MKTFAITGITFTSIAVALFSLYGFKLSSVGSVLGILCAAFGLAAFLFIRGESRDRKDDREFSRHRNE